MIRGTSPPLSQSVIGEEAPHDNQARCTIDAR